MTEPLKNIPANLVTGMLGAGKTTLIQRLLDQRPAGERWAVLVNEFGETGIDGARLREQGAFVREVAGGCMGCAAAVTLKVELNRLLREARPHRLLIEPTGLGHPRELLSLLSGEFYRDVLDLRATLCLVDARRLAEPEFTGSRIWQQQLESADVLVGSKSDLWSQADRRRFEFLCEEWRGRLQGEAVAAGGELATQWLEGPARAPGTPSSHVHDQHDGGYQGCGWQLSPELCFAPDALGDWLRALPHERLKGALRTPAGGLRIDGTADELNLVALEQCGENRLQLIGKPPMDCEALRRELMACALRAQ